MKKTGIIKSKVLNNLVLNLFGIQIIRILLGRIILKIKRIFLNTKTDAHGNKLLKDGIVIIHEFLNEKAHMQHNQCSELTSPSSYTIALIVLIVRVP